RPLLLAIFLCYIILPAHTHLTRRIPGYASIAVLTGVAVGALYLLALMLYASALELSDDLPRLIDRALRLLRPIQDFATDHLRWMGRLHLDIADMEGQGTAILQNAVRALIGAAASVLTESVVVGFYLLFLLLEAGQVPRRVRSGFPQERAEH